MRYALTLFVGLFLGLSTIGCAGGKGQRRADWSFEKTFPDGTRVVYREGSETKTDMRAPNNAKTDSTIVLDDHGATVSSGSVYEPQAIDWTKKNYVVFYWAAVGCVVAGLVCIFVPALAVFGLRALGTALIAAGAFLAFLPTIIDTIGVAIAIAIFVSILGAGLTWVWARRATASKVINQYKQRADAAGAKLTIEGKTDEAIAARRVADPQYDKTYKAAKTANKLTGPTDDPMPPPPKMPDPTATVLP